MSAPRACVTASTQCLATQCCAGEKRPSAGIAGGASLWEPLAKNAGRSFILPLAQPTLYPTSPHPATRRLNLQRCRLSAIEAAGAASAVRASRGADAAERGARDQRSAVQALCDSVNLMLRQRIALADSPEPAGGNESAGAGGEARAGAGADAETAGAGDAEEGPDGTRADAGTAEGEGGEEERRELDEVTATGASDMRQLMEGVSSCLQLHERRLGELQALVPPPAAAAARNRAAAAGLRRRLNAMESAAAVLACGRWGRRPRRARRLHAAACGSVRKAQLGPADTVPLCDWAASHPACACFDTRAWRSPPLASLCC